MRYWAYLIAKLAVAGASLYGIQKLVVHFLRRPDVWRGVQMDPFTHDLTYTLVVFLFMLFATGVVWAIIWDQRYRCRTCLRRLRMPLDNYSSSPRRVWVAPS